MVVIIFTIIYTVDEFLSGHVFTIVIVVENLVSAIRIFKRYGNAWPAQY